MDNGIKGIILAGGIGTRLYPLTLSISKQLLPVFDKPMIYYPLSIQMLAGIRDVLLITTPEQQSGFRNLLGDGSQWGISLSYEVQSNPGGLAEAFIIGRNFVGSHRCNLVLGDNIFYGHGLIAVLRRATHLKTGATVFGYQVGDPEKYGVVSFDDHGVEKPSKPASNWAVTGLYFYDNDVLDLARQISPSPRGELEITDINRKYLERSQLHVEKLGRGYAWLDAGTHESLLQASEFVRIIEERQGLKIACIEEIAYNMGFIDSEQVARLAEPLRNSGYGDYLLSIL